MTVWARSARALSLAAALAVTLFVTAYPRFFADTLQQVPHGALVLLMLGVSAAYVHGVGFVPDNRWLKALFGPAAAWAMIGSAACLLALA